MKKGFSLIELIVVLSLMLLVFSITIVNYSRTNMEVTLEKEAKKFSDVLYIAKDKANSGDTQFCNYAQGAAGTAAPQFSYRLRIVAGTPVNYILEISCVAGIWRTISTSTIDANINVTGDSAITFLSFNRGVTPAQNHSILMRHVGLSTNDCVPISVNPLGVIEMGARTSCTGFVANNSRCFWNGTNCLTLNNCDVGNDPPNDCASFDTVNDCNQGNRDNWRLCL